MSRDLNFGQNYKFGQNYLRQRYFHNSNFIQDCFKTTSYYFSIISDYCLTFLCKLTNYKILDKQDRYFFLYTAKDYYR
jgi:hypothetical protein